MKRSVDHILTTHAGSLPRPADLLAVDPGDPTRPALGGAVPEVVPPSIVWASSSPLPSGPALTSRRLWGC